MILAIDAGNSNIVMGCIDRKDTVYRIVRMKTDPDKTEFEYAAGIRPMLEMAGIEIGAVEGVIMASVVPTLTRTLQKALKILTGLDTLVVGAGVRTGLNIMIDDPGTIAANLVDSAVAVRQFYPLPCVIADLGTATTVTVVDRKGHYIGGAIMPGVEISLQALTRGASLLPNVEIAPPQKVIASNTTDSMKAGLIYGNCGALDGILDRYLDILGEDATVVATGEFASTICPHCRHRIRIDEDLLLRGLGVIWEKNRSRR